MPEEKKNITIRRSLLLVLLFAVFSAGVFLGRAGWILSTVYDNSIDDDLPSEKPGEFRFIRPLRAGGDRNAVPVVQNLKPFRYKINALIENRLKDSRAETVSVYFRDLNGGLHFGIHDQVPFSSEGLLKLPLMIAYFKMAESDPQVLRRTLTFMGSTVKVGMSEVKSYQPLIPGRSYSVDDLIFRMIVHDDEDARELLSANIRPEYLDRVFKDVYVNYDPQQHDSPVPFSAYASFYRVLYHASYLNKAMSEKALRYLSRSAFKNSIVSGIPSNIDCAIKFRERTIGVAPDTGARGTSLEQVHIFGIVYLPNRPYLMGVMARGPDREQLKTLVRDITTSLFEEMDHQTG
jgi:beta-lactamase class A